MTMNKLATLVATALLAASMALPSAAQENTDDNATGDSVPSPEQIAAEIQSMQDKIDSLQAELKSLKKAQARQRRASLSSDAGTRTGTTKTQEGRIKIPREVAAPERVASNDSGASAEKKQDEHGQAASDSADTGISLGGAMRFQYSYNDFDTGNERRVGDQDFDVFRLDLHGKVDGVLFDMQWRWFQYMSALHHAWVGYDFGNDSQLQLGLTRIPFGNQPYNSHSFFFSSNYYLGLEDTQAMGAEYVHDGDKWNTQLAFFKNDNTGSVGAGAVRNESYSYNVLGVREPGEGDRAAPQHPAGAVDTGAVRVARTYKTSGGTVFEIGVSGLYGGLDSPYSHIGHYDAEAVHANVDHGRWNFQAQATRYEYHTDRHASRLAVGAYADYASIPARARSYTLNAAYHLPVDWGPVSGLDFYNDYSLVTHKSAGLPDTWMDVMGVGVSAGFLYTYIDYVMARNQPFIGGVLTGNGGTQHRLNINFGFYF